MLLSRNILLASHFFLLFLVSSCSPKEVEQNAEAKENKPAHTKAVLQNKAVIIDDKVKISWTVPNAVDTLVVWDHSLIFSQDDYERQKNRIPVHVFNMTFENLTTSPLQYYLLPRRFDLDIVFPHSDIFPIDSGVPYNYEGCSSPKIDSIAPMSREFLTIPHCLFDLNAEAPHIRHHKGDTLLTFIQLFLYDKKGNRRELHLVIDCCFDSSGNHIVSQVQKVNNAYLKRRFKGKKVPGWYGE